jgi:hypothetical protein
MCWDMQSLFIGFAIVTFGVITLAIIAILPQFNTTSADRAATLGGGLFASVFVAGPLLADWLMIGDGAIVVCALVVGLLLIFPPINTTSRRRAFAFGSGIVGVLAVALVTVQIAQGLVTPTCLPL